MRDTFINPANGAEYVWHTSHEGEGDAGLARTIQTSMTTGGTGKVFHQVDDQPFVLKWQGKYDYRAQHQAMWAWYELCRTQTIYLSDFDGQVYEGQITSFRPTRQRKLSFTGRDAGVPHHYWSYEFEFTVYRIVTGDLAGVHV